MPTLTATGFNTEGYVLVEADWTDTPSVTYAKVTRRNTVTGETVELRPHGAYDADGFQLLNCGIGIWWDTEPPLNVELEYCTTAPAVETILNANPGFETGIGPWSVSAGTLVQSALNVHSGSFSGLLTADGTGSTGVFNSAESYVLESGIPATLSFWAYAANGWNAVRAFAFGTDSFGATHYLFTSNFMLPPGEYRYASFTDTFSVDVTNVRIFVNFLGTPPAATVFHLDDIQVTQARAVTATACDTVTIASESIFLKNPLHPCLDQTLDLCDPMYGECADDTGRISYAGMADDEFAANTAVLYPVNRARPIAVNRVRRDASSTLAVITHDCDATEAVKALNEPGDPLLFQDGTGEYCIEDRYMSVGVETVRHIGVDQRDEFRLITLPYVVVDRPEGPADGPCGTRFEDLCDIYGSWAALEMSDLDWIDLPTGGASNSSPGNTPSPDARTWDEVEAEFTDWTAVTGGGTRDWDELRDGL